MQNKVAAALRIDSGSDSSDDDAALHHVYITGARSTGTRKGASPPPRVSARLAGVSPQQQQHLRPHNHSGSDSVLSVSPTRTQSHARLGVAIDAGTHVTGDKQAREVIKHHLLEPGLRLPPGASSASDDEAASGEHGGRGAAAQAAMMKVAKSSKSKNLDTAALADLAEKHELHELRKRAAVRGRCRGCSCC